MPEAQSGEAPRTNRLGFKGGELVLRNNQLGGQSQSSGDSNSQKPELSHRDSDSSFGVIMSCSAAILDEQQIAIERLSVCVVPSRGRQDRLDPPSYGKRTINKLQAPLTSSCTELTLNMCCCWMGRAPRWGGGGLFACFPLQHFLPSARVSGPSCSADCS